MSRSAAPKLRCRWQRPTEAFRTPFLPTGAPAPGAPLFPGIPGRLRGNSINRTERWSRECELGPGFGVTILRTKPERHATIEGDRSARAVEQRAYVSVCSEIAGISMPTLMPSLLKYFITVGALLFVGLIGLNAVMEPGGPGPRIVQDTPKSKLVRHDPRASLVERLREEEAAQKASGKAEASPVQPATTAIAATPAASAPAQPIASARAAVTPAVVSQPARPALAEPPVAPAQVAAQLPASAEQRIAPAALTGLPTEEEARANRAAEEKAASEKARKKRAARERARARAIEEASASRQQDRYYYGQRPAYAYAPPPRPAFGPFTQNQGGFFGGGWGRGW
jgi:hypothetical protein